MNKYGTLMAIMLFLVISTFLASSIVGFDPTINPATGMSPIGDPGDLSVTNALAIAFNSLGFFFNLLLFKVEGIPNFINLLVFWPLTIGLFFMLISLIRGSD